MQILALLLAFPLVVSLIYQEELINQVSFLIPIGVLVVLGSLFSMKKPTPKRLTPKDGLAIVSLVWIIYSLIGALPFLF